MPPKVNQPAAGAHAPRSTPLSLLSEWVRQGTESFFAAQRILLDLVMRQNANAIHAVRERLAAASAIPASALTEVGGEGISNFMAAQRVLLNLVQRQNEIVMTGIQERSGGANPVIAITDLVRRGVDIFIEMQLHFLTTAARQTDAWIDARKTHEPFHGKTLGELARESMETFVRSQKKFLDVVAEEATVITGGPPNGKHAGRKTELTELARQSAEAFIDAQKKLLDVASEQMRVNVKAARRAIEVVNPAPGVTLADLTRQTVEGFVTAQKALWDVVSRPARAAGAAEKPRAKRPGRKRAARARAERSPVPA